MMHPCLQQSCIQHNTQNPHTHAQQTNPQTGCTPTPRWITGRSRARASSALWWSCSPLPPPPPVRRRRGLGRRMGQGWRCSRRSRYVYGVVFYFISGITKSTACSLSSTRHHNSHSPPATISNPFLPSIHCRWQSRPASTSWSGLGSGASIPRTSCAGWTGRS